MPSEPSGPGQDSRLLAEAVELARRCPPSSAAYAVGAVVVGPGPAAPRSVGWSRAHHPQDHAEEVALAGYPGDPAGGTLYSCWVEGSTGRSAEDAALILVGAADVRADGQPVPLS